MNDPKDLRIAYLEARLESALAENARLARNLKEREAFDVRRMSCMGVGGGSGSLFVYGDYDSIKAAQAIVFRAADLAAENARLARIATESAVRPHQAPSGSAYADESPNAAVRAPARRYGNPWEDFV